LKIAPLILQAQRKLPKSSGVYLFLGCQDQPLYIGKSVNLRSRVGSYLREKATDQEGRIRRMVSEAKSLRHIETTSELLALLLEDALIKRYLPVYNIRQKQFREYCYLRLTEDPFPRLEVFDDPTGISSRVYGPFRDRYFIDNIQQVLSRYLGFRSCTDANPTQSCIQLDLGQCLGPCVLNGVHEQYKAVSLQVAQFLEGNDPGVIHLIESEISESIDALQFEHAKRLRDDLVFCDSFFSRQRFNHRFRTHKLLIKASADLGPGYHFENGALKEIILKEGRISEVGEQLDIFELSQIPEDDPRFLLDRANLIYYWLNRNKVGFEFSR